MRIRLVILLAALPLMLWRGLVALGQPPPTQPPKTVLVGIYENEPKVFMDSQARPTGFWMDILKTIAKQEQWHLVYVPCEWQACLRSLEGGDLDLMPDVAHTAERDQAFDFNQEVVLSSWSEVYVSPRVIVNSFLDLDQKRIGVLQGSIQEEELSNQAQDFGLKLTLVELSSFQEIFEQVSSGSIDAGLVNVYYARWNARRYAVRPANLVFNPAQLHFAVAKGDPLSLIPPLDRHIRALTQDPKSVYYQASDRWLSPHVDSFRHYVRVLWLPLSASATAIVVGVFAIWTRGLKAEIDRRQQAEDQLLTSDRRYASLIGALPVGIFRTNAEGHNIYMNDRCCEIVGLPLEQALGIGWTVAIHPEDRGQVWRAWLQAQAENRPFQREYRFLKPDGQVVWVYGQAVPERDSNGEICGYVGSVTDISDRKRAEERLKKQEGRLRLAIQSAGMICWEYNSKTQEVKYWGRYTALGWQPDSTVSDRLSAPAEHLENYSYLLKPITPNQLINVLGQTSPLAAPPLKPLKPGAIVSPGPDWSTLRLLVVEDSPINQSVIQGFLGALDLKVDCVASGKAALEILQQTTQSPYALILMDCQMPEMDGYETTQYIRQGQAGALYTQVPIIALTAHAMPGDREKCLAAGMNDYLTKPLTLRDLRSMLRQWLNQPPSADRFPLPQPQSLDQPSDLESIVPSSLESAGSDPPVPK